MGLHLRQQSLGVLSSTEKQVRNKFKNAEKDTNCGRKKKVGVYTLAAPVAWEVMGIDE